VAGSFIVACAATLYVHGHRDIRDALMAPEALRPLAGDYAYIRFASGYSMLRCRGFDSPLSTA